MSNQVFNVASTRISVDGVAQLRQDIVGFTEPTNTKPIQIQETGGSPIQIVPASGGIEFTVTVTAQGQFCKLLMEIAKERDDGATPKFHTFDVFDGVSTTTHYKNCLFSTSSGASIDMNSNPNYSFTFSATEKVYNNTFTQ